MPNSSPPSGVIILAAGLGKRMRSSLPKVLHEIGGEPLIFHILTGILRNSPESPVAVIVGHGREAVEAAIRAHAPFSRMGITFIHQPEQRGTGDAARCAMDSSWGEALVKRRSSVLVLPGDVPLLPAELIAQMLQPLDRAEALRLLTTELPDPTGYGRVVRKGKRGEVFKIVEQKDATVREHEIREVNVSIYLFQASFLRAGLQKLSNKNAQKEFYLTDMISQAVRAKRRVDVLKWPDADALRGINDAWELTIAGRILNSRCLKAWSLLGVRFIDPRSTWIDVSVELSEEVTVHPGAILRGRTQVARGAVIGPGVVLKDVEIGEGVEVKVGTVAESSKIGAGAVVGPYAHLRPGSEVGARAKIGNFVELKKAVIGEHTSIAHLSYVGDAEIGKNSNIGCGFITCNFDGRVIDGQRKHRTYIGDDVFMGSDCQVIAPVRIESGAYVASGSTITQNVESGALAIARSRQVTKPGYARKLRGDSR